MLKHRLLLALALTVSLTTPASVVAQDGSVATASSAPTFGVEDTRLAELEALVPEYFAGLPLRENMQSAPGELLAPRMDDDERAIFESMLEANDRSVTDHAAANVPLRVDDTTIIIIQPHRVTGIDAAATLDAWSELLSLDAERPVIDTVVITGQEVTRVSDEARPDFPRLHLFAAGDIVWMVAAQDEAVVEEAVRTLTATAAGDEIAE